MATNPTYIVADICVYVSFKHLYVNRFAETHLLFLLLRKFFYMHIYMQTPIAWK